MTTLEVDSRPAFYARAGSRRRELITLLHPPYTAWHLSYVVFGALAAPTMNSGRLLATLAAFLLAVGVAAHAFDELRGRPLATKLSSRALAVSGGLALFAAVVLGAIGAATVSLTLAPLVALGAGICVAYNFELAGGRFHTDAWFALSWGAFPALTSYWINALTISPAGLLTAVACAALSVGQRRLSAPARTLRRRTVAISGLQEVADGSQRPITREALLAPLESALRATAAGLSLLALGLLAARLT